VRKRAAALFELIQITFCILQSSGTDPKTALDKALFEQMQSLANKRKEATKESKD